MDLLDSLRPICFVCKKKVEKIEGSRDFRTEKIMIAVYCHGDVDYCEMSSIFFVDNTVAKGFAFLNKRIEHEKSNME